MRHLGGELFVRVIRGVISGPGSLVSTFPTLLTILVHIPAFLYDTVPVDTRNRGSSCMGGMSIVSSDRYRNEILCIIYV